MATRPSRSASRLPTGTITFLFTDIEGSTLLLRSLGDAYAALLSEHNRIVRDAIESAGGTVVGAEGDSVFAAFEEATAAVEAAVAAQRDLAAANWPEGASVRVRMGLHTGTGVVSEESYVGIDVHRAARIAAAGHGGQILISESTWTLVEQALPSGVRQEDLGRHRLKDLAQPERLHQLTVAGLRSEFPALRSLDATVGNLPAELTSFVGRAREVAEARQLLAATRLLTLTGPGGTGKTRLGVRLAAEAVSDFEDGVYFVPLGPIDDPGLVSWAIVRVLGLREVPSQTAEEILAQHLKDRCVLLVLDNFEHVLSAAGAVAGLLRASPGLRIVVTSRARLHVYGESEYEVPPLALPEIPRGAEGGVGGASGGVGQGLAPADVEALARSEAVALFVERARAVKRDFELTPANGGAVAAICARLDGLPLAIELVAARLRLLPPQALLARLGNLDTMQSGPGDLPARQRTLRGAMAWSHDMLDPASRKLFARLSVFVGGASLEAVEAVCGPDAGLDVLSGLEALVDQSLVRQEEVAGEPRFGMLLTIRDFAMEQLAASSEVDEVCRRHATFFVELAEASGPGLTGPDQRRLLDRLELDNGNLRAVLTWAIERGQTEIGLRLGFALWRFWQMRGLLTEGALWLDRLLALPDAPSYPEPLGRAYEAAGGVAYWRAEMETSARHYQSSLEVCRSLGDPRAIANALYNSAFPRVLSKQDVPDAIAALEESLVMARALGDDGMVARILWGLGNARYFTRDYVAARDTLVEALEGLRPLADPFSLAWAQHTLGLSYNKLGETLTRAAPLWREAMDHFAAVGDVSGITILLRDFSLVARARGWTLREVRLVAASEKIADEGGAMISARNAADEEGVPQTERLDPADVASAVADGRRMSVAEAVAYALADDPAEPGGTGPLRPGQ